MISLDMKGPYEYTSEKIDKVVTKKSPGNYALGYNTEKNFIVQYVGRSDTDMATELKAYLSDDYKRFKYSYASSPKAVFEKECKNYHDFGGEQILDNEIHPASPADSGWKCPYVQIFHEY